MKFIAEAIASRYNLLESMKTKITKNQLCRYYHSTPAVFLSKSIKDYIKVSVKNSDINVEKESYKDTNFLKIYKPTAKQLALVVKKETKHLNREDQIVNIGDCVYRPAGFWTKQVHKLLYHIHNEGFKEAPKPLGFDVSGREIVSFLKGEVSNYPLSSNAASIRTLISAANLLRRYHDASQNFLANNSVDDKYWQLPYRSPKEVICHGDFAPYNVVLNGEKAVGIIDFDTCHPGPRTWDIAYAIYRWAPLTNPNNKDGFGSIEDQIVRARLFCKTYGLAEENRTGMPDLIIERLQSLVDFMFSQAKEGNKTFELNIQNNHHLLYLADAEYIKSNKLFIEEELVKKEIVSHE